MAAVSEETEAERKDMNEGLMSRLDQMFGFGQSLPGTKWLSESMEKQGEQPAQE
jgi:hypothetical protein